MTVWRLALWTFAAWALANATAAAEVRIEQRGGVLYVMEDDRASTRSALGRSVSTTGPFSETAFRDLINQAAERYALPITLIEAVIRVESNFDPRAISSKGARGLMQLMPGTALLLGVRDAFDVAQNIDGGARHLRALVDRYAGNLAFALAAYNAGAEAVTRHGGIPPFAETRAYIDRVLRLAGHTNLSPTVRSVNPMQRPANIHEASTPDSGGDPARSLYQYRATDGTLIYSNHPIRPSR